jgi:hypothetical protein
VVQDRPPEDQIERPLERLRHVADDELDATRLLVAPGRLDEARGRVDAEDKARFGVQERQ